VVVLLMGLDSFAVGIKARVWIAGPGAASKTGYPP